MQARSYLLNIFSIIIITLLTTQTQAINKESEQNVLNSVVSKLAIVTIKPQSLEHEPAKATGFFVSKNGLFITSYHTLHKLKKALGGYNNEDFIFSVHQENTPSKKKWTATLEKVDQKSDLLSLNVRVGGNGVDYFKYDPQIENQITLASTKVYTYGYPGGYEHLSDIGVIKSFEGPELNEHLWVTSMEFKSGQSGSPVYLKDGRLVGLVKGSERNFDKNNFFVPVSVIDEFLGNRLERLEPAYSTKDSITNIKTPNESKLHKRTVTRSFYERNPHCAEDRDIVWHVKASEGWKIETGSIKTTVTSKSRQSHFRNISDISSNGFRLNAAIRNHGECVEVLGSPVVKDGRGSLGVDVKFNEVSAHNAGH